MAAKSIDMQFSTRPTIRSVSNPQIKRVQRLRQASGRRKSGLFLIDGRREIELAIMNGVQIETLFHSGDLGALSDAEELHAQQVTPAIMERISYGERNDTPVAVARTPGLELDRVRTVADSLVLVLDRTEKPGNLGACIRTASACGVAAVVLTDPICEVFNPNTIRASRGAVFTVPIAIASPSAIVQRCADQQLNISCAQLDGTSSLWECDFSDGCAIVLGNEAEGLGVNWHELVPSSFLIPMHGDGDSLNLSISAAVTLYEAVRQRITRSPIT